MKISACKCRLFITPVHHLNFYLLRDFLKKKSYFGLWFWFTKLIFNLRRHISINREHCSNCTFSKEQCFLIWIKVLYKGIKSDVHKDHEEGRSSSFKPCHSTFMPKHNCLFRVFTSLFKQNFQLVAFCQGILRFLNG